MSSADGLDAQGERHVLYDVGFNDGSGIIWRAVDLGQGGGAAGFVGKTSAVIWMCQAAVYVNLTWQEQQAITLLNSYSHAVTKDMPISRFREVQVPR